MPQLVQVDGVGQVEFGDEFTPADIARQVDSLYLRKEKSDIGPGVAGRAYGALGAIGDGIQWGFKKLNWAISSMPASVADVAEGWMSAEQNAELMNAGEAEPGGFRNLKAWWHGATTQYQPTWKEIDESPDLQNHFWESVGAKTSKAGADLLPRLALMKGAGALGAGQAAAGAAAFAPGEEGFNARGAILGALVPATQQLGKQAAGAVLGKIGGGALPAVAQKSIEEMGGLAAIQTLNEALALPDRVKQYQTNPDDFWQQIASDTVVNLGFLALSAPGWKAGTPSETQQFISRRARNLPVPSAPSVPEVPFTPIDVAPPGAKPPTPEEAAQPTAREEARAEFEARREQARLEAEASRAAARTRTVPPLEPEPAPPPFVGPVLPPPAAPAAPVQDERARRLAEIEARVAEARTPPQFIGPGEAPPGQVKVTDTSVYEEAKARLEAQRAELEAKLGGQPQPVQPEAAGATPPGGPPSAQASPAPAAAAKPIFDPASVTAALAALKNISAQAAAPGPSSTLAVPTSKSPEQLAQEKAYFDEVARLERERAQQLGTRNPEPGTAPWRPPRAEPVPPIAQAEEAYTLADAVKEHGGLSAPDLDASLNAMKRGQSAQEVVADWSKGAGEYDALPGVLEEIQAARARGDQREYRRLRTAYERAFTGRTPGGLDEVLDGLRSAADTGIVPPGGVPEDASDLIARHWQDATRTGGQIDRQATALAQEAADFESFTKSLRATADAIYSGEQKLGEVRTGKFGKIFVPTPEGERLTPEYQRAVLAKGGVELEHGLPLNLRNREADLDSAAMDLYGRRYDELDEYRKGNIQVTVEHEDATLQGRQQPENAPRRNLRSERVAPVAPAAPVERPRPEYPGLPEPPVVERRTWTGEARAIEARRAGRIAVAISEKVKRLRDEIDLLRANIGRRNPPDRRLIAELARREGQVDELINILPSLVEGGGEGVYGMAQAQQSDLPIGGGPLPRDFNPLILRHLTTLAGGVIEHGAVDFPSYTKAMHLALDGQYQPYYHAAYNQVRDFTEAAALRARMTQREEIENYDTLGNFTGGAGSAGGGSLLSGTVGGDGRPRRPGLRVVDEGNLPAPRAIVRSGEYQGPAGTAIDETQRFAVNLALTSFESGKAAFLLGDGTGVGKTGTELVIAAQSYLKSKLPSLIVTQNRGIIDNRFKQDLIKFGVPAQGIEFMTYDDLSRGKVPAKEYGVVIYDEAHNLKNAGSLREAATHGINARHKVFATATPMDGPAHATYFLSELTGKTKQQIANRLGFSYQTRIVDGKSREFAVLNKEMDWGKVIDNIRQLRGEAVAGGQLIRREYPFFGRAALRDAPSYTSDQSNEQAAIGAYWDKLIDRVPAYASQARRNLAGQKTGELSRWAEIQKLPHILQAVEEDLAAGKHVIVFAEGINSTLIKGLGRSVPGFLSELGKALDAKGIKYAKVFEDSPTQKAAAAEAFQKGGAKVLLATPRSGGAGLDMDDQFGNAPRQVHAATLNFSGDVMDQMFGRVSRRNTASPADFHIWRNTQSYADGRRVLVADRKLRVLRNIQAGEDLDTSDFESAAEHGMLRASNARVTAPSEISEHGMALRAHHGTGHQFERFTTEKIGTGEGAQVYGWGLYFAENPAVSAEYAQQLGRAMRVFKAGKWYVEKGGREIAGPFEREELAEQARKEAGGGNEYTVSINADPEDLLDWDKPVSYERLNQLNKAFYRSPWNEAKLPTALKDVADYGQAMRVSGSALYDSLAERLGPKGASEFLQENGIKGIRYLDQGSRQSIEPPRAIELLDGSEGWEVDSPRGTRRFTSRQEADSFYRSLGPQPTPTYNYVIFDESAIRITHKNGQPIGAAEAINAEHGMPTNADDSFQFEPIETSAEQALRLQREERQAKAAKVKADMLKRTAAGLTGTTGDLGQGDLLGAPQDLWAGREHLAPTIPPGGVADLPVEMQRTAPGSVGVPEIEAAFENVSRVARAERGGYMPTRIKRFYNRARGIYKEGPEVSRIQDWGDIPARAHELAHDLGKQVWGSVTASGTPTAASAVLGELEALGRKLYGTKTPLAGYHAEGFAEFMRHWLSTDDVHRVAPETARWLEQTFFRAKPQIADALERVRSLITTYRLQGAEARAREQIRREPGAFSRIAKALGAFIGYQGQFESFAPLERASAEAARKAGRPLAPSEDPFQLASWKRGSSGATVETWATRHMTDLWGNPVGPSLNEVFAPIKGQRNEFLLYLFGRRAIERWKQNKNPGISRADAEFIRQKFESPAFNVAAQKYYDWWDGVLSYAVQADPGMADVVKRIKQGSEDYAPLARMIDPAKAKLAAAQAQSNPLMRMRGSGLPVKDIFDQTFISAARIVNRANRSLVTGALVKLANIEGMGRIIERIPRGRVKERVNIEQVRQQLQDMGVDTSSVPPDKLLEWWTPADIPKGSAPIIAVGVGKNRAWFEVDPNLYETLDGLQTYSLKNSFPGVPALGAMLDLTLAAPARLFRLGTTGLRPAFSLVTNPLRDIQTLLMQSNTRNPAKIASAYLESVKQSIAGGPLREAFYNLGAHMGQPLGLDISHTRRVSNELFHGRVLRTVLNPLDHLRQLLSLPESFARIAELKNVAEKVGWRPGTPMNPDQAVAMALAAKRSTVDFSASGNVSRILNQAVPFYNPGVQGLRSFARAFRDNPTRTSLYGLAFLTAPALLNWWQNKDKEWYRALPYRERYLRNNIDDGKNLWRIPRAFEWGMAFQAAPEAALDQWYQHDPQAAKKALGLMLDTANPLDWPVLPKAYIEQKANWQSFWQRPIVTDTSAPPAQQFGPYTTRLARDLASVFPELSPQRIDHLISSLGGGATRDALDMLGLGAPKSGREFEPADVPVVGVAARRGGQFSAQQQHLADFYDRYDRARAEEESWQGRSRRALVTGQPAPPVPQTILQYQAVSQGLAPMIRVTTQLASVEKRNDRRQQLYRLAGRYAEDALRVFGDRPGLTPEQNQKRQAESQAIWNAARRN